MAGKFSLSINIQRDAKRDIPYFPTPNAMRVAELIASEYRNGIRTFTLIGSYGTGKSSFLWAFGQSLTNRKHFFDLDTLEKLSTEVVNLSGEFTSITGFFGQAFGLDESANDEPKFILAEIYQRFHRLGKKKSLLVILVDEFGKLLEYAARTQPERELFFLQQLAEFVNNPDYNILLVTALHQNFDTYAMGLSQAQRMEWSKVKGRFREITFNEPVEQLLFLAAEQLGSRAMLSVSKEVINRQIQLFADTKAFGVNAGFAEQIAYKLYPLDLFAGSVLTLALQRYGQNERSLFSFLESSDFTGINQFSGQRLGLFYNLANVYDYLQFNFYALLNSQFNPDFNAWAGIKRALERAETVFEHPILISQAQQVIKTAGLMNLFASQGAKLNPGFFSTYIETCIGFKSHQVINALLEKRILLFREYNQRFVLFDGTDKDIKAELLHAGDQIGEITDVPTLLNRAFDFPPVFAKEYFYRTGTPRVFEFIISQEPKTSLMPKGNIDGYINLIFNDQLSQENLIKISKEQDEAVLYAQYRNAHTIKQLLYEIEKTKKAIDNVKDDSVAKHELQNIQRHQESLLHHYIFDNLYAGKGDIVWIFNGRVTEIKSKRDFNIALSRICQAVYPSTPQFRNELVNRSKLTSQIFLAKKLLLHQLADHWGEEDLGFDRDKFPPEKTIYLSLIKRNGLAPDPQRPEKVVDKGNLDPSFHALWDFCEDWLQRTKAGRMSVADLVYALGQKPFKLKQGLVDFWVPIFLFLRRDDFALFGEKGYIPTISGEILELMVRKPREFEIKAFDIDGVRLDIFNSYRQLVQLAEPSRLDNKTFVETIRPFLTFYRLLPEYARNTSRLSNESLAVRNAIARATDPEKTFFDDLPASLGVSLTQLQHSPNALSEYSAQLQGAIREIRTCFDELINRFESFIRQEIAYDDTLDFASYKLYLRNRFQDIKTHLLLTNQKTFVLRLQSELDDRKAWLMSIAQAVTGKPMEQFRDEDEVVLYDKFKSLVLELDSLTHLSKTRIQDEKEDALGLEIATFEKVEKRTVRFPKQKKVEINRLEEMIKNNLGKDKTLNIAALVNVLKDLLQK